MPAPIIDAGKGIYPAYQHFRKMENRFACYMQPTQIEGANRILTYLFRGKRSRALLEDGTGVGKTMQLLSIAWTLSRYRDMPSLMLTKTPYLAKSLQQDANSTDIKAKRVHFATYDDLKSLDLSKYGFIGLDEAHELIAREAEDCLQNYDGPILLASATAFSTPELAVGFRAVLENTSREKAAEKLGITFMADQAMPSKGTWREVCRGIHKFRQSCMRQGGLVKRDLAFTGDAHIVQEAYIRDNPTHMAESLWSLYLGEKHLGRSTVLYLNPKELTKMELLLQQMGEDYVTLAQVDKFKDDRCNLVLLGLGQDAEGIRLHDRTGRRPRTVIISEPREGGELRQIEGRVNRRNSQSAPRIILLVDPESEVDASKLEALQEQAEYFRETQSPLPATMLALEDISLEVGQELSFSR